MQVLNSTQVGGQFAVSGGDHNAFGTISQEMSAAVPVDANFETIRYDYTLVEGGLTAPISKGDKIGTVRVWYGNVCLAQQDLLSASDVAEARNNGAANRRPTGDESLVLWNGILKIALGIVAGLFILVCVVRIGNTIKRSRRRRRKAAAKQKRRR
jgi:hypothetical protein